MERTLVGLIYSKLENAEEDVQTRDELIDKRYVDAVADLMRDERRNGQDPGESAKTKPIILVDDKLVNGHHTICALHKIGWERCKIVKMSLEEHFAGDWDIVETFGEAIKHYNHALDVLSHHNEKALERGRILFSCATLFRQIGDNMNAKNYYK